MVTLRGRFPVSSPGRRFAGVFAGWLKCQLYSGCCRVSAAGAAGRFVRCPRVHQQCRAARGRAAPRHPSSALPTAHEQVPAAARCFGGHAARPSTSRTEV